MKTNKGYTHKFLLLYCLPVCLPAWIGSCKEGSKEFSRWQNEREPKANSYRETRLDSTRLDKRTMSTVHQRNVHRCRDVFLASLSLSSFSSYLFRVSFWKTDKNLTAMEMPPEKNMGNWMSTLCSNCWLINRNQTISFPFSLLFCISPILWNEGK